MSIEQLHSSRSNSADFLTLLRCFPASQIRNIHLLCSSSKNVVVCFTITSNLTVTTCVFVNNVESNLFVKGIFITEQQIEFAW